MDFSNTKKILEFRCNFKKFLNPLYHSSLKSEMIASDVSLASGQLCSAEVYVCFSEASTCTFKAANKYLSRISVYARYIYGSSFQEIIFLTNQVQITGWNYNDLKTIDSELRASEAATVSGRACIWNYQNCS